MSRTDASRIAHYELATILGSGGMGDVYLATDTRLRRRVALKLLPRELASDELAKQRFIQEARTASALNHPHIVAVFDIGSDQGQDYIAMEFVEGETLRAAFSRGAMETKRALDLIAQAATALGAAHDAGIVHRDIKPENLMVTKEHHLKVLDFGVAKLTEQRRAERASEAVTETATPALTRIGTIVGTAAYMSPEQAQSQDLDGRSDVFSLGAVLYEALTGVRAFAGKSVIDTLHAVLHTEPQPVTALNPQLPAETADVLAKALAKERADRYRHADDFALDLRRLKRALDTGSLPSVRRPSTSPARAAAAAALVATAVTAVAVVAIVRFTARGAPGITSQALSSTLTPLTSDAGYEGEASFSPDGETIAYSSDRTGNLELFLKQVSGGPDVNITNDPADDFQSSFSPDGRQIAFVSTRAGASERLFYGPSVPAKGGDVWVMAALGGNPRRVASGGNFPSWSPDGSEILYASGPWFGGKLYRIAAAGGTPREIPVTFASGFTPSHVVYPRLSADSRWIVFATPDDLATKRGRRLTNERGVMPIVTVSADSRWVVYQCVVGSTIDLHAVASDGGDPRVVVQTGAQDYHPSISPSGRWLYFYPDHKNLYRVPGPAQDWRVAEPERVTDWELNSNRFNENPQLSRDGRHLAYSRGQISSDIWLMNIGK